MLNEKFKKEVSKAVSDSVLAKSYKMVFQMAKSKVRADSILTDIERQHDAVLEAATNEFGRTIEVTKINLSEAEAEELSEYTIIQFVKSVTCCATRRHSLKPVPFSFTPMSLG